MLIKVIIVVLLSIVCIAVIKCLKAAGRADKWGEEIIRREQFK